MEQQTLPLRILEGKDSATGYISVASGKGGVGKTLITINMGRILHSHGKKVLLIDGDLGLSNIHLMLGITPAKNLYHFFSGGASIEELVVPIEDGFDFISSGSGIRELVNMPFGKLKTLIMRLQEFAEGKYDWVIFDTPPGIHSDTIAIVSSSQMPIIITTPEPTAIADAYGLVKVMNSSEGLKEFFLIVNKVSSEYEGKKVYESIRVVCEKYTTAEAKYAGSLRYNPKLIKNIIEQNPFSNDLIKELNQILSRLSLVQKTSKESFWEKLLAKLKR
ncbi:MinD/ParA family protein [Thermocrinis sp.]